MELLYPAPPIFRVISFPFGLAMVLLPPLGDLGEHRPASPAGPS